VVNDWRQELADAMTDPGELGRRFAMDTAPLKDVISRYPMRVTPSYLSLISAPGDPIWRQCIPDLQELEDDPALVDDPLAEEELSPVPGLIHRYPDRAVLLVSAACPVYCRFCMRKRGVGCGLKSLGGLDLPAALAYLAAHPAIRDIIISGGEPLLLEDEELDAILSALRAIPHIEIIRIGSRAPVTLPSRITPALCALLRKHQPLYLNTHFNHPLEITPRSAAACSALVDAGIPLGNQTVLLRGVNDDPAVMGRLMNGLLRIRVRPYYIHQMDLVRGTAHFRTPVATGLAVVAALRGHTSGLATPAYVIDLPGGKGKVPLLPEPWREEGGSYILRTYTGDTVHYRDCHVKGRE
jgi:lysine 2,3-aminomutase